MTRGGFEPAQVEEIILGNVLSAGVGQAPARQATLRAGMPPTVAALTINKVCGSGLKAVMLAAQEVRCGDLDLVVAGGMESMSQAGWVLPRDAPAVGDRQLIDSMLHDGLTCPFSKQSMGEIADALARQAGISREEQDRFARESHRRALAADEAGAFAAEMVSVPVRRGTDELRVSRDEGPRIDTDPRVAGQIEAGFPDRRHGHGRQFFTDQRRRRGGRRRFGSDCQAFGQAATTARIVAAVTSGAQPQDVFTTPVEAIQRVVAKANCSLDEIDLFEINEAFAVQMLACMGQLRLPPDRVNVHGGAIALGHPIGA